MDFNIGTNGLTGNMEFNMSTNILNNIFLSLTIKKGSFFFNPEFGSRLHILKKNTENNAVLARDYCKEALQWLLDSGKASSIDVTTERDTNDIHRLKILVEAVQANGEPISFETFVEVV